MTQGSGTQAPKLRRVVIVLVVIIALVVLMFTLNFQTGRGLFAKNSRTLPTKVNVEEPVKNIVEPHVTLTTSAARALTLSTSTIAGTSTLTTTPSHNTDFSKATVATFIEEKPTQGLLKNRWKLYGSSTINKSNTTSQKERSTAQLFNNVTEAQSQKLIESFQKVPVLCSSRLDDNKNSMSETYGKFLKALSNYSEFHAKNRDNITVGRMVWYCGDGACGGMGDRVRGLTVALLLAMISNRVLLFDWHESRISSKNYVEPNFIDWRLTKEERQKVFDKKNHIKPGQSAGTNSVVFMHIFAVMGKGGLDVDRSTSELMSWFSAFEKHYLWLALETNVTPDFLLYGHDPKSIDWIRKGLERIGLVNLNRYDFNRVFGLVFRYLFEFSQEIVQEIANARKTLGLNGQSYIGLHVRTGFVGSKYNQDSNHPKLLRNTIFWEKFIDCAHKKASLLGQENKQKDTVVYVATDSNQVKDEALKKYGNSMRSLNTSVIHIDKLRLSAEKVGEKERQGVMSVWVEISLLAEAHSIVMGESGFSFLAASLCLIPKHRVIDGKTCTTLQSMESIH